MNPVAFTIFGLEIRWYAIFITLAMMLGGWMLLRWGKQEGFIEDHLMNLLLVALPGGVIGARIYYVIFSLDSYKGDFWRMINIREGGLAIHGGIIAGIAGVYLVCRYHKMSFFKILDLFAPLVSMGQGIGRWGNYVNQEAHGGPTSLPWGIMVNGVRVHPTFLYESIWDIGIFFLLMFLRKSKKYDGQIMGLYLILYSIGRFWIEGLRTDSLMLGPLRIAQVISLIFIGMGMALLILRRKTPLEKAYRSQIEQAISLKGDDNHGI